MIFPLVGCKVPAIILYKVDFPAPFEPITVIKSPLLIFKLTFFNAVFSSGVPSLKTIPILGQIPGGLIDATVAGVTINRIGKYTIDYCQKLFKQELFIDYIKNAINSINLGVDELLNIANNYKK